MFNAALGPYTFAELTARIQASDIKSTTHILRKDINQWSPIIRGSKNKVTSLSAF
jgi:hypothetical protein